jgi:hypothetical protein
MTTQDFKELAERVADIQKAETLAWIDAAMGASTSDRKITLP